MSPVNELSELILFCLMVYGVLWIASGILRVTGLGDLIDRIFERCMLGEELWAKKLAKDAERKAMFAEQRRRADAASAASRAEYASLKFMRKP
jgi:hypothetical protein